MHVHIPVRWEHEQALGICAIISYLQAVESLTSHRARYQGPPNRVSRLPVEAAALPGLFHAAHDNHHHQRNSLVSFPSSVPPRRPRPSILDHPGHITTSVPSAAPCSSFLAQSLPFLPSLSLPRPFNPDYYLDKASTMETHVRSRHA
jgi:hypothetical protein